MISGRLLGLSCLLVVGARGGSPGERWLSRTRQVELLVVVDASLARALGSDARPYVLALLSAADRLYRHPALGSDVRLAVVRIEVLWDEARGPRVGSDAAQTLHEFCRWQRDRRVQGEWAGPPYDAALLLTRQNLCQENFCESLGLGHIGTVCEADGGQNCAVVQDIGLQSAFTVAHEIGHLLGMAHDNSEICLQMGELSWGYQMMSPMLSRINFSEPWSRCSIRLSLGFLASGRGDCLLNKPSVSLADSVPLAGVTYDRDVQCRLTFGPGYRARPGMDPCPVLWCLARRQGEWHHASKQLPAADGTPCGGGAVCLRGRCTHNWKQLSPVDGSWGSWGPWGSCSRSCGGGVQFSRRHCDNPVPANFGRFCLGRREKFQSCNLEGCPENGGRSFRQEQCEERNGQSLDRTLQQWEPYYHGIRWPDLCKLNCLLKGTSQVNVFSVKVKDGTRCFPHSQAVCVQSQCVRTGCDGLIGSGKRFSPCGVCGGPDADCERVIHHYHGRPVNYSEVGVIPRGAAGLKVVQRPNRAQGRLLAYLALQSEDGTFLLNGGGQISGFASLLDAGGVALHYSGWSPRRDALWALTRAPLAQGLRLAVYNPGPRRAVRLTYSYYLRRQPGGGSTGTPMGQDTPVLRQDPIPDPSPIPSPDPSPIPRPDTSSIPIPDSSPIPRPDPSPIPRPDTSSIPRPDSSPIPRPDPSPIPRPDPSPIARPDPTRVVPTRVVPTLDPTLVLRQDPTSAPLQHPTPVPTPDATLQSSPAPAPDLRRDPSPVPTPGSWQTGPWQFCSVTCGVGWVARRVVCVDGAGRRAEGCCREQRPRGMALCVRGACRRGWGSDTG
ncbi:A disintegrin and metalloproteinase with thrombospondin motifs 5-like [Pristis pectinata]|uniref:A disintegrin and metalloproteinase with thrombospondin motifs 5-like n=1 Tax=Pristis pectinata TaxID=685728 RepID=UPI00223E2A56|nr:A disintegrin and metalloproteinase with thrombospondin motifs 5-like [Pristis pectinata]